MPSYGLGNFLYEVTPEDNGAKFKFWDEHDASNTAECSVNKSEFPEGVTAPDTREVAELAYGKVGEKMSAKRDERIKADQEKQLQDKQNADANARKAAADLAANQGPNGPQPVNEEKDKDGNITSRVFTTDNKSSDEKAKK